MALDQVLTDNSFKVNSPKTFEARKSAESVLRWCMDSKNKDGLEEFTRQLEYSLKLVRGYDCMYLLCPSLLAWFFNCAIRYVSLIFYSSVIIAILLQLIFAGSL